jgi:lipopolysaccharide/colanic/teichoic acid biosynthesis glycosyltransferase
MAAKDRMCAGPQLSAVDRDHSSDQRPNGGLYARWGKRGFDLVASGVALIVLSPVLAVCALLVKLTSSGPVFFRQVRLGLGGQPFKVFKFRTMQVGSERGGPKVVVPGDQRLTPVGATLRRTKLDEFPQLINVFLGDMSLVGPRPRVPAQVSLDSPVDRELLRLRPGLTSYGSLHHRLEEEYCLRQDDPAAALQGMQIQKGFLDGDYVRDVSFTRDLKLILITVVMVLLPGKGKAARVRLFGGLEISGYSRAAQIVLEIALYTAALWLAYWLRFEGSVSPRYQYQMAAFIMILPAMRLATNAVFGVYRMIWRYVNLVDAAILLASLSSVTGLLVALRLLLPVGDPTAHFFQMPLGVIVLEYLLSFGGALGLRALRRAMYEMDHRFQPLPVNQRRRILVMGAGFVGVGVALEIARNPHLQLVGFVDDDPSKRGRLIAGSTVLGTSEELAAVVRSQQVQDVIICGRSVTREGLGHMQQICSQYGVGVHVIPALDQILGTVGVDPLAVEVQS